MRLTNRFNTCGLKTFFTFFSLIMTQLFVQNSHAFGVDSMIKFSEGKQTITYQLTNETDNDLFINTELIELETGVGGELVSTPYNSENFEEWNYTLSDAKLILRKGASRTVIVFPVDETQQLEEDKVLRVRFKPRAINNTENTVSMNYGYGVLSIFETKDVVQQKNPMATISGDSIHLTNPTNKFLAFKVCDASENNCVSEDYLIPGRTTKVGLPDISNLADAVGYFYSNDGKVHYEINL